MSLRIEIQSRRMKTTRNTPKSYFTFLVSLHETLPKLTIIITVMICLTVGKLTIREETYYGMIKA